MFLQFDIDMILKFDINIVLKFDINIVLEFDINIVLELDISIFLKLDINISLNLDMSIFSKLYTMYLVIYLPLSNSVIYNVLNPSAQYCGNNFQFAFHMYNNNVNESLFNSQLIYLKAINFLLNY